MKVLIFSTYFLPIVGGVQTYVRLLAQGLSERGMTGSAQIEVTVATETPASDGRDATLPYRVFRRPSLWKLKSLIDESDILHLAGPSMLPMMLAWLTRKPFTIEQHGYQAICPNGLLFLQPEKSACPGHFRMKHYIQCIKCRSAEIGVLAGISSLVLTFPRRWLCNRAMANIAITDHVKARLGLKRSCTIYYGIDVLASVPAREATSPAQSPSFLKVAYVGRLVAEKGLPLLLHAAQRLKEEGVAFQLLFIGDGPERSHLQEMATQFQIEDHVTFTGDLRYEELARAVRDLSIVVMPSIWEETAGLSAIEHMMRGGVVIAADIGGLSEVVGDAGLKFRVGDWQGLSSCIRRLSEEPSLVASLGKAARARALQLFDAERMLDRHVALHQVAMQERAPSHDGSL